ncbi:hypothetical protein SAMN06265365_1401 [Tistlia consotensis]|uniref:DUF1513 domain-containing protein n=1 Tax=Tistlia consotensis USBA 355 TaxID=560819 RepID=A0A1Y6CQ20_9PROT|nr:DUF1513 domain-containing protein [Tistlia consotensis]SMF81382.1 hypothetical protein SAMN05428998_14337 [Tistlia consotensis USBA 355]SNS22660.1 hypothetical protein SAMN06265365_1401 [Tistlia consotensis]
MAPFALSRRRLLGLAAGAAAAPLLSPRAARAETRSGRLYLSCCAADDGQCFTGAFTADGRLAYRVPLPERGHSLAVSPDGSRAVQFSRRPGSFAVVFDPRDGRLVETLACRDDRRFNGHGAFAPDGRLVYLSENDFVAERGVLGVYDARDGFRRVAELPSHGIGPHELRLMPDGTTLAVCNGGIQTRPDLPRIKLNIPTMEPSLAYLDRRDGRLLGKVHLPAELHLASIRHLAVRADGLVAFAMQYQGPRGDLVPLVATHAAGARAPRLFEAPEAALRALEGYVGSATLDASGEFLAVSSPRGGAIQVWEVESARPVFTAAIADGCGIAATGAAGGFLASSGVGGTFLLEAVAGRCRPVASPALEALHWDHHIVPAAA